MKSYIKTTLTGHNAAVYDLLDIAEEGIFVSTGGDGYIVSWDRNGNNPDGNLIAQAGTQLFSLGKYEDLILAGAMTGDLFWINRKDKKVLKNTSFHKHGIFDILALSNLVFTAGGDGCVGVWDPKSMALIKSLQLSSQGLRKIIFDPLRKQLIVASSDNNIYFVDPKSLEVKNHIIGYHTNSVFSLCVLNPDVLISGSRDAQTRTFDLNDLTMTNEIAAHLYSINEIVKVNNLYATASRDKRIRVWNHEHKLLHSIDIQKDGHLNSVNSLLWMEDQSLLWSCSDDRTIRGFTLQMDDEVSKLH